MPRPILALVALLLALLVGCGGGGVVSTATPTPSAVTDVDVPDGFRGGTIAVTELPAEARETLALIEAGGPYPYDQDDGVFQNREGLLPARPRGTYHEYTVETPGSSDRGARRIITGGAGERYYTDDHYDSFLFVVQS